MSTIAQKQAKANAVITVRLTTYDYPTNMPPEVPDLSPLENEDIWMIHDFTRCYLDCRNGNDRVYETSWWIRRYLDAESLAQGILRQAHQTDQRNAKYRVEIRSKQFPNHW